mmetsp:Transcript_108558/g.208660  ORF Transcript_108558/g.208660 Transcript_108558/m.208660 type:complete len:89 (-) Transcript_108558:195-461(-)
MCRYLKPMTHDSNSHRSLPEMLHEAFSWAAALTGKLSSHVSPEDNARSYSFPLLHKQVPMLNIKESGHLRCQPHFFSCTAMLFWYIVI